MLASPEQWAKAVKSVVNGVRYEDHEFRVQIEFGESVTLRVAYWEPTDDIGASSPVLMVGRPWVIEFGCHPIQIVQTCFLALMTSMEHRIREEFTWQGLPIMHPHRTEQEAVAATRNFLMRRRGHEEHRLAPASPSLGVGEEKTNG